MTTRANDSGRSEVPSGDAEDDVHDVIAISCDADGPPYELTTHYLLYGPSYPDDYHQAMYRADSRNTMREHIILDYRLIE